MAVSGGRVRRSPQSSHCGASCSHGLVSERVCQAKGYAHGRILLRLPVRLLPELPCYSH